MPRLIAERRDALASLAEVFRDYGYEGASLSLIGKASGLGKGSLYHFFPGGKDEMMSAVLADIDGWFEANIYALLRNTEDPGGAIRSMFAAVAAYFSSGRRVCLMGMVAISSTRDRFALAVASYFRRWIEALEAPLQALGYDRASARLTAEEIIAEIQGAIVLSRAMDDPLVFERAIARMGAKLTKRG